MINKVAVFCGSSTGKKPSYTKSAIQLGNWLADNQYGLVYGGANLGLMGTLAETLTARGGHVTGIMPTLLTNREISNPEISEFIEVPDMHSRKKMMTEIADAFIAMPGGCGTMEEIFEIITWSQIGIHEKPFAFFNVDGYFNHLQDFLFNMEDEGFIVAKHRKDILISSSLEEIHEHILNYHSPGVRNYR